MVLEGDIDLHGRAMREYTKILLVSNVASTGLDLRDIKHNKISNVSIKGKVV